MPGKRKIKPSHKTSFWPCGTCRRNSLTDSIFCESCKQWFHANCENLSGEEFGILEKSQLPYTCNQCFVDEIGDGPYNYHQGLLRLLQTLPYGHDILRIASKRENQLLPDFEFYRKPVIPSDFIEIDLNAKAILDKCFMSDIGKPSLTSGNGNCLFNAVSIALTGHEGYATELRLRTAVDMSMNREIYKCRSDFSELLSHSPTFEESLADCCNDTSWSSIFTMMSLSIVVGKPIRSVYPPMNGRSDPAHMALSKVFWSQGKSDETLTILWSRQSMCKGKWCGNHFVPVIHEAKASNAPFILDSPVSLDTSFQSPPHVKPNDTSCHDSFTAEDKPVIPEAQAGNAPFSLDSPVSLDTSVQSPPHVKHNDISCHDSFTAEDSPASLDTSVKSSPPVSSPPSVTHTPVRSQPSDISFNDSFTDSHNSINSSTPIGGMKRKADFLITDNSGVNFKIYKVDNTLPTKTTEHESVHGESNNYTTGDTSMSEELPVPDELTPLTKLHSYQDAFTKVVNCINVQSVVPPGNKSNSYILIDNTKNIEHLETQKRCEFYDDCGVWDSSKGNTRKSTFVRKEADNSIREVEYKSGNYCVKRRLKGKVVWEPLEPQPQENEIIIMSKYYTVLKRKQDFKKRVTFFYSKTDPAIGKVALYEYQGTQPNESEAHGNANKGSTFVRTNPETLNKIRQQVDSKKPREIFHDLKMENSMTAPRDFKVVRNVKQSTKNADGSKSTNIADEVLEVLGMLKTHPFVQTVINNKDKVPSIICYTEEQILDLQYFLTNEHTEPIGIDRTFNLGSFYVTSLVYKNSRLLRKDTNTNPVFIGPMLLHKDATYKAYKAFLEHVETAVDSDIENVEMRISDKMEFGTDDEKALTKAIDHVFPNATRLLCTKHLKDNLNFHIQNKVGMDKRDRSEIMSKVFGSGGIIDSDTTLDFQTKTEELQSQLKDHQPALEKYFSVNLKPRIEKYVFKPARENKSTRNWTNNSAESINNIMKISTDWKPKKSKELIQKLSSIVHLHYADYRAALHGHGNYILAPDQKHYNVHDSVWRCKSDDEKTLIFNNFLNDTKRKQKTRYITSKDGLFSVINKAKGVAKKPCQRKRARNERVNKR